MNLVELDRALRQLRLSGMAAVLETRLRQAQSEKMAPLDLVSALVADELRRRQIVIAGAFVAQRLFDQNKIGRRTQLQQLAGRGHADEQLAA